MGGNYDGKRKFSRKSCTILIKMAVEFVENAEKKRLLAGSLSNWGRMFIKLQGEEGYLAKKVLDNEKRS